MIIKHLFHRYLDPENEDGGGAVDRGDDFVPTDDEPVIVAKVDEVDDDDDTPPPKTKTAVAAATTEVELTDEEKEAAAAAVVAAEAKAKPKDTRIPASRHTEILNAERAKREAVETELALMKKGGQTVALNTEVAAAETKLVELEKKYADLLTDGKSAEAVAVMTEIRRTERAMNEKVAQNREQAAIIEATERTRYETVVERLETQFPQLNIDHEDFDEAKTREVMELKMAYQATGRFTATQALQKAVKLFMPPETKAQEAAVKVTPRVDAAAVEAARKAAAVEKVTDALAKTPANAAAVGRQHDAAGGGAVTAKDIIKMPYKDFEKLDETALARARGDVL